MKINDVLKVTLLLLCCTLSAIAYAADPEKSTDPGDSDENVIIEKNLFSPERKKWEMPKKDKPKTAGKNKKNEDINAISLYGTVITEDKSYAILRSKKSKGKGRRKKGTSGGDKHPYMVGDYIGGYLVKEIKPKNVVLRDEAKEEEFVIFISEEKKDRSAVKTEIKNETPVGEPGKKGKKPSDAAAKKKPRPRKAETTSVLKKRMERHLKVLKRRKSALVKKQALRDYKKLEKLMPDMQDPERREIFEMKKELDKLLE